jgi:tRNA pseudouridine38-40 synthase
MTVAYDGTDFGGFQVQKDGVRTVQSEMEGVLYQLYQQKVHVECSGRTDAGVHARGQVVHFDAPDNRLPGDRIKVAFNSMLPADVRVNSVRRAPPGFHARFSATGKEYRYKIWTGPVLPPLLRNQRWHHRAGLDAALMREAATHLVGRHDFAAFAANPGYSLGPTVREIHAISVQRKGHDLEIRVRGSGFLHKMVRSIAGGLAKVGRGDLSPSVIPRLIEAGKRDGCVPTAPAQGLILWSVFYGLPITDTLP